MLMNEPRSWRFDAEAARGPRASLERYTQAILCSLDLSGDSHRPACATHFVEVRAWPGARGWQWELDVDVANDGVPGAETSPDIGSDTAVAAQLATDVLVPFMLTWRSDVEGGEHEACAGLAEHIARSSVINDDGSCTVHFGERELAAAFSLMRRG